MNDVRSILNENPSKCFEDVDKTICELVRYIDKLESRITDLEETVGLLYSEYESEHEPFRDG